MSLDYMIQVSYLKKLEQLQRRDCKIITLTEESNTLKEKIELAQNEYEETAENFLKVKKCRKNKI